MILSVVSTMMRSQFPPQIENKETTIIVSQLQTDNKETTITVSQLQTDNKETADAWIASGRYPFYMKDTSRRSGRTIWYMFAHLGEFVAARVRLKRESKDVPHRIYQEKFKLCRVIAGRSLIVRWKRSAAKRPCVHRVRFGVTLVPCSLPARIENEFICPWHVIRRRRASRRMLFRLLGRRLAEAILRYIYSFLAGEKQRKGLLVNLEPSFAMV